MTLSIDRRLKLVIPIYKSDEGGEVIAYVHSTPLAEEVVAQHWDILGQTNSKIWSGGHGVISGPMNALRALRQLAMQNKVWEDDPTNGIVGAKHVVEEMSRLSNVAALNKEGRWEQLPLSVAIDRGIISQEDKTEVENAIAFFTVGYAQLPRAVRKTMLDGAVGMLGAQLSSLDFTAFCNSLKTSTATASSGEKPPAPASEKPGPANATVGGKRASVPV